MKDKQGRPYLKVHEANEGIIVVCDGDFTCLKPWTEHEIHLDEENEPYIICDQGHHGLDGQLDDKMTHYVGLYLKDGFKIK